MSRRDTGFEFLFCVYGQVPGIILSACGEKPSYSPQILRQMPYIHQLHDWPKFTWPPEVILAPLGTVRHLQGKLLGKMAEWVGNRCIFRRRMPGAE